MNLLSCSNCWFNGLQYGPLGLSAGYCAEHRVVLRQADWTTCPRHMRKDLAFDSAVRANRAHRIAYRADRVQLVIPNGGTPTEFTSPEPSALREDPVGDAVADFGELDSKIESLAQLNSIPGARAEIVILTATTTGPGRSPPRPRARACPAARTGRGRSRPRGR